MDLLKRSNGKNRNKREKNVLMWNNRHNGLKSYITSYRKYSCSSIGTPSTNCTKFVTDTPSSYQLACCDQTTIHLSMQQDFSQHIAGPLLVDEGQGIIDFHITQNVLL
jgi:hypothetical protein